MNEQNVPAQVNGTEEIVVKNGITSEFLKILFYTVVILVIFSMIMPIAKGGFEVIFAIGTLLFGFFQPLWSLWNIENTTEKVFGLVLFLIVTSFFSTLLINSVSSIFNLF